MNALTYTRPEKGGEYTLISPANDRDGAYKLVDGLNTDIGFERLYLFDMGDEILFDRVAERVFDGKSRVMIAASRTLDEVGAFDKKYGLDPIMFLYRTGLLEKADAVVGGVWLDKDDVDLMVQCGCPLILTPSYDMGRGHGIAETVMYVKRGLKIGLGTEDCSFNAAADVSEEARLLSLVTSALNHNPDALGLTALKNMINFTLTKK